MAKSTRDFHKRELGYALACLDKAMQRTLDLKVMFDQAAGVDPMSDTYVADLQAAMPKHPHAQYAMLLHTAIMGMLQSQSVLHQFAKFAWGKVPPRVERWTNTGQDYKKAHEQ